MLTLKLHFGASRPKWGWVALVVVALLARLEVGAKPIKLRSNPIDTPDPARGGALRAQADSGPLSGLYLIQFEGVLEAGWRAELERLGVQFIKAVPVDAFLARLKGIRSDEITSRPYVRWVGPYSPAQRVEPGLARTMLGAPAVAESVSALVAPGASPVEMAEVRRQFTHFTRVSQTGQGMILEGRVEAARFPRLARAAALLWVERAPRFKLVDGVASQMVAGVGANEISTAMQDLGYDGAGVVVAVADSGLHNGDAASMHADLAGRVDAFFYYGDLDDASDEHGHGTHVSGIVAGDGAMGETDEFGQLYGLGVAPGAHIIAQRIFDGLGGYQPPDSFSDMARDALRAGADIGSNSWGDETQGRYDLSAMEFDALARDGDNNTPGDQPYILEFSAGNAGPSERSIYSPAVGKNVIATGAVENNRFDLFIYADGQETMADFSSRGPAEDGRIKPDVVAPGTWIASLQSGSASDENAWLAISPFYQYQGGTSQAGPHASGAAAVFTQYYRENHGGSTPSPALVKGALINSAVDMESFGGTTSIPNNDEGWGRIDLTELIGSEQRYEFVDQTTLLKTGEVYEKRIVVAGGDLPLKITLTYTDVPGFPPAIPALVNDLDLEVVAPNGDVYRGNQFFEAESVANTPGADRVNNVEGVHLAAPPQGEYVIRVLAYRVVEDSRRETAAIDQDFALVASGDIPLPGRGVISLNKQSYRVPGEVAIKLIDFDLSGQPSAQVTLGSASMPIPLTILLQPLGPNGVFTGLVATAVADGSQPPAALAFNHGDLIEAKYLDASPAGEVVARARGDFRGPVISHVGVTNQFAQTWVLWTTDEPALGEVYFGQNGIFDRKAAGLGRSVESRVALPDLVTGQTYQCLVVAMDEAGNRSTNDNGGLFFTFTAQPPADVLVVDAYTPDPNGESVDLPVSEYTEPIARMGVPFDVWDVATKGSPKLSDVQPYRILMWRINDSFYTSQNTISPSQQTLITDYVAGGGGFFMASMEILSRVGAVPFRTNILNAVSFKQRESPLDECPDCDEDRMVPSVLGAYLEPLTTGVEMALDYSQFPVFELEPFFPNIGPDLGDIFSPGTNAVPILLEPLSGGVAGVKSPRPGSNVKGRVVFLAFPLEAVPMDAPEPNNRAHLLRSLFSFLSPGVGGLVSMSMDRSAYTIPSRVVVEVPDPAKAGAGSLRVSISSGFFTNALTLRCEETVTPGLFRGEFTLTTTNEAAATGRLPAADGDLISAQYHRGGVGAPIEVFALVDTVPPVISDITVEEDYELAVIRWRTSKPTDSLVQFGESAFLNRTAYAQGPKTEHELVIGGLLPSKKYFFQAVSRDPAGNVAIDDNFRKLHTFETLTPKSTPWMDDFEGSNDWSVLIGEESEGGWELGTPSNSLAAGAHSPANAWATNLRGETTTYVQSYLISPAVRLADGNTAKLTFHHNYDFLGESILEVGTLAIYTNALVKPVVLRQYGEFTAGWEEEQIDISAYIGRTVQFVWLYEMLDISFENVDHPGWLIDDVRVEVSTVLRGNLEVANNLCAATFAISGPQEFQGEGRSFAARRVETGAYTIAWGAVPYYIAPPPQTATLAADATLTFTGQYTFEDANSNAISDAWERERFGEVSPTRTRQTDTDGDGLSDHGEFIAGTDPLSTLSNFTLGLPAALSNNRWELTWNSQPGRFYRVLGSVDAVTWLPFNSWTPSVGTFMTYTTAPLGASGRQYFKVEVTP